VSFLGWDETYNEVVNCDSDRLRPASMFDQLRQRLENDRFLRRVKIYGALRN
jgi:hypothetical protein